LDSIHLIALVVVVGLDKHHHQESMETMVRDFADVERDVVVMALKYLVHSLMTLVNDRWVG
jgi:formyltetrahydrofolate hydrolase